jgi:hypothetical protein
MADKQALVDSGATDNFMHPNFAKRMGLGMKALPNPKKIFNIDNTTNKSGMITHYLNLNVVTKGIHKEMHFLITDIGREDILLGYPWLATFEPKFDWRSATMAPQFMLVIISSINPRIIRSQPIITVALSESEKHSIVQQLVTDLQGPPSGRTQTEKLQDLKKLAKQYARDQESCDNIQLSYLETLEDRDDDNLRLTQMLAM